ncbi:hypothetical protein [Mycobacterium shigaense]|uniref:hypothetical protein n=1 Tax=Mycobacterium shigaense TaxID=722731 RepID=UPI0011AB3917|nr:hypothetical protein [Mycobacterium shigaense]
MAHLALIAVYVVAAFSALAGIGFTVQLFISDDPAETGTALSRRADRRGPILVAVGIGLGLIANTAAGHLPPSSASDLVAPSSMTDQCDNNDGLFGLCGAGQLNH